MMTRFFSGYFRVGKESEAVFQYIFICLAAGCLAYIKGVTIFDLVSSISYSEYYKVETFPLTFLKLTGNWEWRTHLTHCSHTFLDAIDQLHVVRIYHVLKAQNFPEFLGYVI